MAKFRNRDLEDLRDQNLKATFRWIHEVKPFVNFLPTASETWGISLSKDINTIPDGRVKLEKSVKGFFLKRQRNKGVLFCWRHTSVIVIVFS